MNIIIIQIKAYIQYDPLRWTGSFDFACSCMLIYNCKNYL